MNHHVKNGLLRSLLIGLGWISVIVGIVGIFLPLVPTVPCLLLAALCFSRSSSRFHDWLLQHRHLGPLLRGYLNAGGIPLRAKVMAIGMLWLSVTMSLWLLSPPWWIKLLLIALASGVTWYLVAMPTVAPAEKSSTLKVEL